MIHKKSPPIASPFSQSPNAGMPSHNIIFAHTGEHRPTRPIYDVFVPELLPNLDWNPASGSFASAIEPTPSFTRASGATYVDAVGNIISAPINTPRITYDPVTHECLGYLAEEQRTNSTLHSIQQTP